MNDIAKAKVKVIKESETGLNKKVSINGVVLTNNQAYTKAKQGKVDGYHGVKNSDGTKFIRSNPDNAKNNNLG